MISTYHTLVNVQCHGGLSILIPGIQRKFLEYEPEDVNWRLSVLSKWTRVQGSFQIIIVRNGAHPEREFE